MPSALKAKHDSTCPRCFERISKGTTIAWDRENRMGRHLDCPEREAPEPSPDCLRVVAYLEAKDPEAMPYFERGLLHYWRTRRFLTDAQVAAMTRKRQFKVAT